MEEIKLSVKDYTNHFEMLMEKLIEIEQEILSLKNGDNQKTAYSVREAAERLGVSQSKIRNLYTDGDLEYFKGQGVRSKVFIQAESLHSFVSNMKQKEAAKL